MTIKIVLADDHLLVRQGLKVLLEANSGCAVVGEAADGYAAIRLVRELKPDVVILDLAMPLLNGLDAAREILKESPDIHPVLLTMHRDDAYVLDALRAGVHGYVLKSQAGADLLEAVRAVFAGQTYLSPLICRTAADAFLGKADPPRDGLTLREREVLQLIAEGKTSKEVAVLLSCSTRTAESHRARIMKKLQIHDISGLVRYAVRRGLIRL